MGKIVGWIILRAALVAVIALCAYVLLGAYGAVFNVQEDDATWNCHVMGDMNCGPQAPWHGFTNGFKHADYAE